MQPFILVMSLLMSGIPTQSEAIVLPLTEGQVIEQELKDYPLLKEICRCESGLRQTDEEGKLIISETSDHGVCQINLPAHQDKLKEMNLDPDKLEDNIVFAKYLYDKNGTRDWEYSRSCWSKQLGFRPI